jgi:hypothetical protein
MTKSWWVKGRGSGAWAAGQTIGDDRFCRDECSQIDAVEGSATLSSGCCFPLNSIRYLIGAHQSRCLRRRGARSMAASKHTSQTRPARLFPGRRWAGAARPPFLQGSPEGLFSRALIETLKRRSRVGSCETLQRAADQRELEPSWASWVHCQAAILLQRATSKPSSALVFCEASGSQHYLSGSGTACQTLLMCGTCPHTSGGTACLGYRGNLLRLRRPRSSASSMSRWSQESQERPRKPSRQTRAQHCKRRLFVWQLGLERRAVRMWLLTALGDLQAGPR